MGAELDLYARVEHLLGIEDSTEFLHENYARVLADHGVSSVLDIGCGRGGLMKLLKEEGIKCKGIDPSQVMVDEAKSAGLDAERIDICEEKGRYDACVAVFDVLNFMDEEALEKFFGCVEEVLEKDGLLIADVNTLHGFKNVADGTMSAEDDNGFLNVDAAYSNNELHTKLTYFSLEGDGCYKKEQQTIVQYFHPMKFFRKKRTLKLLNHEKISLYDKDDKMLLVFKKQD